MTKRSGVWAERGEAWETLASRLDQLARALVGRGREDDAQDLTQATIARMLARRNDAIDPPPYHYARMAMIRVYLDDRRSWRRRLERSALWARGRRAWEAPTGGDDSESRRAIERGLESLSALQRAAITLRIVEDLPYEAIAHSLDTTPDRVRSALHAARGRLRAALGPEWRDEP